MSDFTRRVITVGYSTFELVLHLHSIHRNPVVSAVQQHASARLQISSPACLCKFTDGMFFCSLAEALSLVFTVAALCLCDSAKQLLQASDPPNLPMLSPQWPGLKRQQALCLACQQQVARRLYVAQKSQQLGGGSMENRVFEPFCNFCLWAKTPASCYLVMAHKIIQNIWLCR